MTRKSHGLFTDLEWRFIELISQEKKQEEICEIMNITKITYYQKIQQLGLKIYLHWQDHKKLMEYSLTSGEIEVETDVLKAKNRSKR